MNDEERVIAFSSFEEMQDWQNQREDEANTSLVPEQIELRDDVEHTRYWVRPYDMYGTKFLIFGEALSYKDLCELSAKYVSSRDDDESIEEAVYEIRTKVDVRKRGYLYGKAYSEVKPTGEWGDTHVANVWPISKQAFDEAEAHDWNAVTVDHVTRSILPPEVIARHTTPTLVSEMEALAVRLEELREET